MRVVALILLVAVAAGYGQSDVTGTVPLDKEFKLKLGQKVRVEGTKLRVRFASVLDDSRCPDGAACVWEGNAQLVFELRKKNKKPLEATLNTTSNPKEVAHRGFIVKLVRLDPHPKLGEEIDPRDYEATLLVSRK